MTLVISPYQWVGLILLILAVIAFGLAQWVVCR
jgi:hypothetical protein